MVKYRADGTEQWRKVLSDPSTGTSQLVRYIRETQDGHFMFAGYEIAPSSYDTQYFYGVLNPDGQLKWSRTLSFAGTSSSSAAAILETGSGFLIPGYVRYTGADLNAAIVTTDADGNNPTTTLIAKAGDQFIYDAEPAIDGDGYVLVGSTGTVSGTRGYLLKIDGTSTVQWEQEYGSGAGLYSLLGIQRWTDANGQSGYMLTGNVYLSSQDAVLIQTDKDGNENWLNTYPQSGNRLGLDVIQTIDGGYAVAGGNNGSMAFMLKTDAAGNKQWETEFSDSGNLLSVLQLADGSYRLAGGFGSGLLLELRVGAPQGLTANDDTNRLSGMTSDMEYSVDGGASYVTYDPANEPLFTGHVPVLVRYKAGGGYEAGDTASFDFTANPAISSVSARPDITTVYGTSLADVGLPVQVEVTLSDGSTAQADAAWDGGSPAYNGNQPGTYTFTGTLTPPSGVSNPSGKTAMVQVVVGERTITAVSAQSVISAVYGTPLEQLGLPAQVEVTLSDGSTVQADAAWDGGSPAYNGNQPGTYTFTGTLIPPSGVTNLSGKTAMVQVAVGEEGVVLTSIEADDSAYRLKVGMTHITVIQAVYSDGSRVTVADPVTFSSSNASIATVQANGLVTGVSPGSASITAQYKGIQTVISVEVWREASSGSSDSSSEPSTNSAQTTTTTCSGGHSCTASLGDEVKVDLPMDLTEGNFTLTIHKMTSTSGIVPDSMTLLSPVFELLKSFDGSFKKPVTLRFKIQAKLLGADRRAGMFYYDETNGKWIEVEGHAENDEFVATVHHFTKFAVFSVAKEAPPQVKPEKPLPPVVHFNDLKGHWAEVMIQETAAKGIVSGYDDGSFKPDQFITRAEFTVMLMRALAPEAADPNSGVSFTDSDKIGIWAQRYVSEAARLHVVSGYADGTFRPDEDVTRAEMTAMIIRASKISTDEGGPLSFSDANEIPDWAKGAAAAALRWGIAQGRTGNEFAPDGKATRAEATVMLMRMLQLNK
ncbi:DUF4073 domain-containing protein [Paenibacillus sp. EPM92]|uniref:DUF4073 domain-containing protein n=1 Tax=Paenibacillus sp. EPM92 TaxID=1561195 RepID=UPI00191566F3|nr:DUF4073 domain-containing protein [Paenibacillus sp. EPM92]